MTSPLPPPTLPPEVEERLRAYNNARDAHMREWTAETADAVHLAYDLLAAAIAAYASARGAPAAACPTCHHPLHDGSGRECGVRGCPCERIAAPAAEVEALREAERLLGVFCVDALQGRHEALLDFARGAVIDFPNGEPRVSLRPAAPSPESEGVDHE